jgi:hypothetical protein
MTRFGWAIRTGGDAEIAGALASGIDRASRRGRPRDCEAVRRVDMMRHTPEEWAQMTEDARVIYGGQNCLPEWAQRLLVGYALVCYAVALGFRWVCRVNEGRDEA